MNLGEIRTELQDLYGNSLTSSDAYYDRAINAAYRKLCSLNDWWFLEDTWVLSVKAPVTSFTATVTQDSATVSAIASATAFTAEYAPRVWVVADDRTFEAITTDTTANTMVLDSEWIDATGTLEALTMWKDTYNLPSDCDFVRQVIPRNQPNCMPLRQVEPESIESFGIDPSSYASEFADRFCVFVGPDSTAAAMTKQIRIFPPPDEQCEYLVRYSRTPSDLSADTDVPYIPEKHHQVLVDMSMLRLLEIEGEDADRIQTFQSEVGFGLANLKKEQLRRGNVSHRFGRRTFTPHSQTLRFTLKNTEGVTY